MKKLLVMITATLLISGMIGCSKTTDEPAESDQDSTVQAEETAPLIWSQIESDVLKFENSLSELDNGNKEELVLTTDEDVVDLVKRVEEGYELLKDGIYSDQKQVVLKFYEAARRLELSGNENVISLGTAAKEFLLGMMGHTVVEDVTLLQDGVISALAYVHSVYGSSEETEQIPE